MSHDPEKAQNPIRSAKRRLFGGVSQYPADLGPAPIGPSQPGALSSERQPIGLPGANYAPAGATPVDVIGDANIAPAASATLLTIPVPATFRLRIAGIGFAADDEVALRFLRWSIRLDGDPVPGYLDVTSAIGSIRQLAEIFQLVGSSQTLTVVATIDAAAVLTYRYIARARGWFYVEREG